MRLLLFSFLLLYSLTFNAQSNKDYTKSIVDFSILNLDGETFTQDQLTTDEYKLLMYFNPSCGSCQAAFKKINLKTEALKDLPIHFYPISIGNKKETLAFFKKYAEDFYQQVEITILRDKDFKFSDLYDVNAYPTLFLYKPNNQFVKSYMGHQKATNFIDYFNNHNK